MPLFGTYLISVKLNAINVSRIILQYDLPQKVFVTIKTEEDSRGNWSFPIAESVSERKLSRHWSHRRSRFWRKRSIREKCILLYTRLILANNSVSPFANFNGSTSFARSVNSLFFLFTSPCLSVAHLADKFEWSYRKRRPFSLNLVIVRYIAPTISRYCDKASKIYSFPEGATRVCNAKVKMRTGKKKNKSETRLTSSRFRKEREKIASRKSQFAIGDHRRRWIRIVFLICAKVRRSAMSWNRMKTWNLYSKRYFH